MRRRSLKKLVKQQFRWARGSQYNTLRMLPWMLRHTPLLAFFFLCDILLPFLWLCTAVSWLIRTIWQHDGANLYLGLLHVHGNTHFSRSIVLTVLTSALAMCLRQARHIAEVPVDFFWMPAYILFSTLVLMPIRIYGFFRCGHVGQWGTRANAYQGGESPSAPAEAPPTGGDRAPDASAALRTRAQPTTSAPEPADGDPRALLPYLIASAAIAIGVLYDVRPV